MSELSACNWKAWYDPAQRQLLVIGDIVEASAQPAHLEHRTAPVAGEIWLLLVVLHGIGATAQPQQVICRVQLPEGMKVRCVRIYFAGQLVFTIRKIWLV